MSVRLGLVGWRGMVGSVLIERMQAEGDFAKFSVQLYSTSQAGQAAPAIDNVACATLLDAFDLASLSENDIIITAQGGDYTKCVYQRLRQAGWSGYWIDAASTLRLAEDACIALDPVNKDLIEQSIANGVKTFVGGNCTVSLLLMALGELFRHDLVEWISTMTYQAASGAGARQMQELLQQSQNCLRSLDCGQGALSLEAEVNAHLRSAELPKAALGAPLAFNVLPFIDVPVDGGQSREEWKGEVELNKILGNARSVPVDGVCVRVPVLRCHSQAFTLKLREPRSMDMIEELLSGAHEWLDLVPNTKEATLARLVPAAVSNSLTVALGRLRPARLGPEYLCGFTVGDQLLWGAAEPLRRVALMLEQQFAR